MSTKLSNVNIVSESVLVTPKQLRAQLPRSDKATETVNAARNAVEAILERKDPRLLVVVGPVKCPAA